jgi:hypothetical protein
LAFFSVDERIAKGNVHSLQQLLFSFSTGLRGIFTESNKQKWQNGFGECFGDFL